MGSTADFAFDSSSAVADSLQATHGQTQLFCSSVPLVNIKLDKCFAKVQTVLSQSRAELSVLTFREKTRVERFFLSSVGVVDNVTRACVLSESGPTFLYIVAAVVVVEFFVVAIFVGQSIFDLLDPYEFEILTDTIDEY